MNKLTVLEAMYEVIKDSTEWGVSEKEYGMFVDGVVAMTEVLLEKEKEKVTLGEALKNYTNYLVDSHDNARA